MLLRQYLHTFRRLGYRRASLRLGFSWILAASITWSFAGDVTTPCFLVASGLDLLAKLVIRAKFRFRFDSETLSFTGKYLHPQQVDAMKSIQRATPD